MCIKNSKAKFQMDLDKVLHKIDNKAPRLNAENYLKSRLMLSDKERMKILDKENLELIKKLNIIYRLGGKVDCSLPKGKLYKSKLSEIAEKNRAIKKENQKLLKQIISTKATFSTAELLNDWKRIEANIEHTAKYPLIWKKFNGNDDPRISSPSSSSSAEMELNRMRKRPRCFFDIELSESKEYLGRMIIVLYNDIVPKTCENFISLCEGKTSAGDAESKGFSYKGTPFHRIVKKYWCQGGDVTKYNGTGGASIYGNEFNDENFTLRHIGPGIISMSNNGPDKNNSKFNITFNPLPTMDGKKVVFGRIIRGLSNLYKIEEFGCGSGKPIKNVIISNCGLMPDRDCNEE